MARNRDKNLAQQATAALKKIKLLRGRLKRAVLTQADIAHIIGVDPNTAARWERGLSLPEDEDTINQLVAIAEQIGGWYLHVAPFILVATNGISGENNVPKVRLNEIIYNRTEDHRIIRAAIKLSKYPKKLNISTIGMARSRIGISTQKEGPFGSSIILSAHNTTDLEVFIRF